MGSMGSLGGIHGSLGGTDGTLGPTATALTAQNVTVSRPGGMRGAIESASPPFGGAMGVLDAQNLSSLSNSFSEGETPGPRIPPGRTALAPKIKGSDCFLSIKIVFFEISLRVRAIFFDKNGPRRPKLRVRLISKGLAPRFSREFSNPSRRTRCKLRIRLIC